MISLNRPYNIAINKSLSANGWSAMHLRITYSSREGLNLIYQKLYAENGSLRVAVSPLTCFIALYPIVSNGHIPVYVDIDPLTLNMSEDELEKHQDVQVVQTIYLGGNPMQMDRVMKWAGKNNVIVIEDCAQALGSMFNGQWLGTFGNYAVASAVKNLYASGGGLLASKESFAWPEMPQVSDTVMKYKYIKRWLEQHTTNKKESLWNALYSFLLKAKDGKETELMIGAHVLPEGEEKHVYDLFTNYTEIQEERKIKAERLIRRIDTTRFCIQKVPEGGISNRNRIVLVAKSDLAKDIIIELRRKGIAANNLTQNYIHPYQEHVREDKTLGVYYTNKLSHYEKVFPYVLTIPCSPALADREIDFIAYNVNEIG